MIEVVYMFGTFLSITSFCLCVYVFIEVKAMQKSTHQIQYVPVDNKAEPEVMTKEQRIDPFARDFDNII